MGTSSGRESHTPQRDAVTRAPGLRASGLLGFPGRHRASAESPCGEALPIRADMMIHSGSAVAWRALNTAGKEVDDVSAA